MMSQKEINKIKQEVKEKALEKIRIQRFKEYKKIKNAKAVCEKNKINFIYPKAKDQTIL